MDQDPPPPPPVIAIDGPAASGKSSVSRLLARRLGFAHLNSGLMYRAATRAVIDEGVDPDAADEVAALVGSAPVRYGRGASGKLSVVVAGKVRGRLADEDVNALVSKVSQVGPVRVAMVALQREIARAEPTVVEGRDIGSVVFPETPYKFYIDASEGVRARRRAAQGMADSVGERDRLDSTRAASPLVVAKDAVVVDTSELEIGAVVDVVLGHLRRLGLG